MAEENVKETKKETKPEKAASAGQHAATAAVPAEGAVAAVKGKKKIKKHVAQGVVHVQASFNNTIITVSDTTGNTLCWATSGGQGFKGSKKGTPFAAQIAAEEACKKASAFGIRSVVVYVRGPGAGREAAMRAIPKTGIRVTSIRDLTPIPHNGCRPPKRRRI